MNEPTDQIDAAHRRLGTRDPDSGAAKVLTISRTYAAEIDDVWDACTDPERIRRWLLPISGELRLGGRYQLEGNAGGVIERCDPPKSFAATWEYGGNVSWIEVRLAADPAGGTRFELQHTAHVDDHWDRYGPGAVGIGWDLSLLGLAIHLAGQAVPEEAEWAATEPGVEFMKLSGQRWCEADIAGGADPDAARAAADRTIAAYTGDS
ncbi:SRPBCC family protein [Nocardia farcinica]|nr:SRPBCC family protein [Nocardia farcinica]